MIKLNYFYTIVGYIIGFVTANLSSRYGDKMKIKQLIQEGTVSLKKIKDVNELKLLNNVASEYKQLYQDLYVKINHLMMQVDNVKKGFTPGEYDIEDTYESLVGGIYDIEKRMSQDIEHIQKVDDIILQAMDDNNLDIKPSRVGYFKTLKG